MVRFGQWRTHCQWIRQVTNRNKASHQGNQGAIRRAGNGNQTQVTPTIKLDYRQFNAAAKALKATSKRTAVDFINGQAFRVATLALKETKAADDRRIEYQLGAVGRSFSFKTLTRGKSKGEMRTKKGQYVLANEDTLAHRILITRKKMTGSFGIKGETLNDKAINLIKSRIAGSHFIRAGWIPSIRKLSSVIKKKPLKSGGIVQGVKKRGVDKGFAIPASLSAGDKAMATIVNTSMNALTKPPEGHGNPLKYAQEGLQRALDLTAKDMMQELERRLKPDFKKASAK
jgi:hypothetical protein